MGHRGCKSNINRRSNIHPRWLVGWGRGCVLRFSSYDGTATLCRVTNGRKGVRLTVIALLLLVLLYFRRTVDIVGFATDWKAEKFQLLIIIKPDLNSAVYLSKSIIHRLAFCECFCRTSLPVASTRRVQLTQSLSTVLSNAFNKFL